VEGKGADLFTVPLDLSDPARPTAGTPEPFLETGFAEGYPAFSPDGRWIAYVSDEPGRAVEVFVRPFSRQGAQAGRWRVSNGGGLFPVWSRAGRQLLYKKPNGEVMVVDYATTADSFQTLTTRSWPGITATGTENSGPNFDLSPDGKRLVVQGDIGRPSASKTNLHMSMMVNWFDEVRRRVPAGK
jgi:eukaryotic-like serine/threonine-protein kinase